MARIVYTLGELTGSIGGMTFQRNNSGAIVRQRPQPSKSTTIRQSVTHANHLHWLYQWQQLSQTQRDDWNSYASIWTKINKWGQAKTLTGQNWFETANYYRADLGESQLSSPPIHTLPQDPPAFSVQLQINSIRLYFTETHDYTNNPLLIWVSPPTKKNTPTINQIRRKALILDALIDNPLNITIPWENAILLPFTPSTLFPATNIFVCLQSISRSSGITSALLCAKENTQDLAIDNLETDGGDNIMTDAGLYLSVD